MNCLCYLRLEKLHVRLFYTSYDRCSFGLMSEIVSERSESTYQTIVKASPGFVSALCDYIVFILHQPSILCMYELSC